MMWIDAGICGAGGYLPDLRIETETIAASWSYSVTSNGTKSVPSDDEDATTLAVEAARAAMEEAGICASDLGAVWVGSESKPYAVKAISATVAEAIGATPWVGVADLEFACRGAIEGLKALAAQAAAGKSRFFLMVATDTAQARPGDELERTAGAGAAAFVLGPRERASFLLSETVTYVTDTPDFYRRDRSLYPTHHHRFTGQPAYFEHVLKAVQRFLQKHNAKPSDFKFAVFHQPTANFARKAAQAVGFKPCQVEPAMLAESIGNPYAANTLLSLTHALDQLDPGDQVLVSCYGSGAGADCFAVRAGAHLPTRRNRIAPFLRRTCLLKDYGEYLRSGRHLGA